MSKIVERIQDKLYHDHILKEETQEIRNKTRDFTKRIVEPRAYDIATTEESRDSFPWDVFKAMAEEDFCKKPLFKSRIANGPRGGISGAGGRGCKVLCH